MKHLDAKSKNLIKKDSFRTCGYLYTDGIVISGEMRHNFKGEEFRKDVQYVFPKETSIYSNNGSNGAFKGRLVFHNATLLLRPINHIRIHYKNTSQKSKEMGIDCTTVEVVYDDGMRVKEYIFHFMSSDIYISDEKAMSITDWN